MDLWIRSQDKNILQKVNKLYVTTYAEENGYGIYDIQEVDDCDIPLGFYKTRERALEVLDDIQRLITDLQYLSYGIENDKFCSYRPNVYKMPKE